MSKKMQSDREGRLSEVKKNKQFLMTSESNKHGEEQKKVFVLYRRKIL